MKLVLTIIAAALVSGCHNGPSPLEPASTTDCDGACKQLVKAECEEGKPSPLTGVVCPRWCSDYHADGYMPPWDVCVSKATSVEAIRACGLKCEGQP